MADNKTEKATPKKRADARKKGQVAKSSDANGAIVLLAAILALGAFGPGMFARIEAATVWILGLTATPGVVTQQGVGVLFMQAGRNAALALAPVLGLCVVAGVLINVVQVGFKPAPKGLWQVKKLNPLTGLKNLVSPNSAVEAVKSVAKICVVGGIVALAVFPRLQEMAALVGMPASALFPLLATSLLQVAQWAVAAYIAIAVIDFFWQRHHFAKQLKMDKDEIKQEHKQQEMPQEIRGARRRKAFELSRARMMDAVPTADVVVTNPTHFSVALRYAADQPAPVVVAKGADHLAMRIRREAALHGVAVVPDPPLARSLYASVDVGRMIPEELYQSVAQLLAYVYKVAGRRAAATTGSAA